MRLPKEVKAQVLRVDRSRRCSSKLRHGKFGRKSTKNEILAAGAPEEQKKCALHQKKRFHNLLSTPLELASVVRVVFCRSIVATLRRGNQPAPESFDQASVSFTDIVGFADFITRIPPFEVVNFLTKAHGLFDGVILNYDAYKVESIGDCYLVRIFYGYCTRFRDFAERLFVDC